MARWFRDETGLKEFFLLFLSRVVVLSVGEKIDSSQSPRTIHLRIGLRILRISSIMLEWKGEILEYLSSSWCLNLGNLIEAGKHMDNFVKIRIIDSKTNMFLCSSSGSRYRKIHSRCLEEARSSRGTVKSRDGSFDPCLIVVFLVEIFVEFVPFFNGQQRRRNKIGWFFDLRKCKLVKKICI